MNGTHLGGLAVVAALSVAGGTGADCDQVKLLASDGVPFDQFGISVGSDDGLIAVGAPRDDHADIIDVGTAYVYRRTEGVWAEEQQLLPLGERREKDQFGSSIAVQGDRVAVGVRFDDEQAFQTGSVVVFMWDGATWVEEGVLLADDAMQDDVLGESVAIDGDWVMSGAPFRDDNGSASGAVYAFRWDGAAWNQEQKLLASDGAAVDKFGQSVDIDGTVAVVGAPQDDDKGFDAGAAYVYRFDGKTWVEEQKLLASDGFDVDQFGRDVAISGDAIVVGAYTHDGENGDDSGGAYVFRFDGKTWVEEQKLTAIDGNPNDLFGISVDIRGSLAVIGSHLNDQAGSDSGAIYVFRRGLFSWIQERKLVADDGSAGDRLGRAVSITGEAAVAGAELHNGLGPSSGTAFVFDLSICICPDFDDDGIVGLADLLQVLSVWGQEGGAEDLDDSGTVDLGDLIFLLSVWGPCE